MEPIIIFAIILIILGVIGSIVPALPGPTLSFVGLLLLFFNQPGLISWQMLLLFGVVMAVLILIDYLAPVLGAKFSGASRAGLIGSIIGTIIGMFFFPPLGIFLGAFAGAVVGEAVSGKQLGDAMRAGIGTLIGSVSVIILQTAYAIFVAIYFFVKIVV